MKSFGASERGHVEEAEGEALPPPPHLLLAQPRQVAPRRGLVLRAQVPRAASARAPQGIKGCTAERPKPGRGCSAASSDFSLFAGLIGKRSELMALLRFFFLLGWRLVLNI